MSEYIMKCPIATAKECFTELVVVALKIVEEKVEPNIVAAANCNGALFALSMFNFEKGILNEQ